MTQIILASQSPRRRQLLTEMGVNFTAIPSTFNETLDETRSAREVAKELALGKALDVARRHPGAIVIGSDTIVAINGRQMEKPADIEEAREMLIALSQDESSVSTGVAVVHLSESIQIVDEDTTSVHFKPDGTEVKQERERYLASEDWKDKAGAYGIQSGAAPLIDYIEGSYDTVVGMPTKLLATMLSQVGVPASAVTEQAPVLQINAK
jgi:septum formation protein